MRINVSTGLGRCIGLGGVLVGTILIQGCAAPDPNQSFAEVPGINVAAAGATGATGEVAPIVTNHSESEMIRRGESLTITFSDLPPGASGVPGFEELVKEDGTITLAFSEVFVAAGKTRGQLEKEIRERYVPRYYIRLTPSIKPKERSYTIGGEVKAPNRYTWYNGMTLLKAVQSAGDFTDFAAKKKVQVTRTDGRKETVNCLKALGDPRLDIPINPGDTIHVPRKLF